MEVDWAGMKMTLTPTTPSGRGQKVSIFVAVLAYSGMTFALACTDQRKHNWLTAHVAAFAYFGGALDVVIPDNAPTASHRISATDYNRRVDDDYAVRLEHYGTAAMPARVRKPKDKATVEAAVKVITQQVIHYLANEVFYTLDDLNAGIT